MKRSRISEHPRNSPCVSRGCYANAVFRSNCCWQHTTNKQTYRSQLEAHVSKGDALSAGAVGGTAGRFQHEQLIDSIRHNVFPLGDHVRILTGHGPCTTVRIERIYNPLFHK